MKAIKNAMRFYSANYLNKNCQFDYSGAQTLDFTKLCDFEPYNEDIVFRNNVQTTLEFSVWFKDKFNEFLMRPIDAIVIQNTNIQTMQVKYADNSENEITLYGLTDNLNSEIRISLPAKIETSKVIFNIQSTFDNTGVKIGQLRLLEKLFDFKATTESKVNYSAQDGRLRTYNGRLIAWTDYSKWAADINAENVSKAQYDLLKRYICRDSFVTLEPFPDFEIKDIYEVLISRKNLNYGINRWSGLYDLNLKMEAQEDASY